MPLWEQVKGNLVEWYTAAADKTEELAKIGVRRYDKFGISRDIERQFTELGNLVYQAVTEQREGILADPTLHAIIQRIRGLEEDLRVKESEIEEIRQAHREKSVARKEAETPSARVDPELLAEGAATAPAVPGEGNGAEPAPREGQTAGFEPGQGDSEAGGDSGASNQRPDGERRDPEN